MLLHHLDASDRWNGRPNRTLTINLDVEQRARMPKYDGIILLLVDIWNCFIIIIIQREPTGIQTDGGIRRNAHQSDQNKVFLER